MAQFKIVRSLYEILYWLIWGFALLLIVVALMGVFTDVFDERLNASIKTIAITVGVSVLAALILSWLLVMTICTIDSRNFLAELHAIKIREVSGQGRGRNADGFEII